MILYYNGGNCPFIDDNYDRIAYVYFIQVYMYLFYCKRIYLQEALLTG